MSLVGEIFKEISAPLVGFGIGLINNNQLKQQAKNVANDRRAEQERDLKIAEEQTKRELYASMQGLKPPEKEKSNLPLYIGLGVGGVVILGLVIFAVTRK
jgi:hypothetical protein